MSSPCTEREHETSVYLHEVIEPTTPLFLSKIVHQHQIQTLRPLPSLAPPLAAHFVLPLSHEEEKENSVKSSEKHHRSMLSHHRVRSPHANPTPSGDPPRRHGHPRERNRTGRASVEHKVADSVCRPPQFIDVSDAVRPPPVHPSMASCSWCPSPATLRCSPLQAPSPSGSAYRGTSPATTPSSWFTAKCQPSNPLATSIFVRVGDQHSKDPMLGDSSVYT
nr:uncharacterized protein LOC127341985 isoform X1 [Lolium perenne]XP_051223888.1 uncharacterized protein LOC127341985 isoform X2 [Lolium perenne]XP_051223891.1 uncharacterized protein LOC127341985 isoform X1 [Lolium perenne]